MGVNVEKGKYRARVWYQGKNVSLGMYKTNLEAQRAITKFKTSLLPRKVVQIDYKLDDKPMFTAAEKKYLEKPSLADRMKVWLKKLRTN